MYMKYNFIYNLELHSCLKVLYKATVRKMSQFCQYAHMAVSDLLSNITDQLPDNLKNESEKKLQPSTEHYLLNTFT